MAWHVSITAYSIVSLQPVAFSCLPDVGRHFRRLAQAIRRRLMNVANVS